jgi:chemotaxis protein CheX
MNSSTTQTQVRPDASWKVVLECAATEVFEIMAGGKAEPWSSPEDAPKGELTAMVGLAGALCGILTVRCTRKVAEDLAMRMTGGTTVTNGMLGDTMGEICNMVAGNFKGKFTNLADHCMLSVPTVISGEDYVMYPVDAGESFLVGLKWASSPVWVCLTVHE